MDLLHALRKLSPAGSVVVLGICLSGFSQIALPDGPASPHFEASSFKVVEFSRGGFEHEDSGRIDYHNVRLLRLVIRAFDVKGYLIQWPSSLFMGGNTFYDLEATFPAGTNVADQRVMLQALLRERLGFRSHMEQRPVPVYALVIAPGGLKVRKAPPSDTVTTVRPGVGASQTAFTLDGDVPLSALRDFELDMDRPIVDETGLEGAYRIHLIVPRGETHFSNGPANLAQLSVAQRADINGFDQAAFFSAVEHQLGLRFEKRTISAQVLVVDSVNTMPTPN